MLPVEVLLALRSDGNKLYDVSKKSNIIYTSSTKTDCNVNGPLAKDKAVKIAYDGDSLLINWEPKGFPKRFAKKLKPYWYIDKSIPWTCCAWVKITDTQPYGTLMSGGRAISYERLSLFCQHFAPNVITTGSWPSSITPNQSLDKTKWYHVAFVKHPGPPDNLYSIYLDGNRLFNGTSNAIVDWDFNTYGISIFSETRGDGNAAMEGEMYDFTFIRGLDLWKDASYTLPTDYVIDEYNIPVGTAVDLGDKLSQSVRVY